MKKTRRKSRRSLRHVQTEDVSLFPSESSPPFGYLVLSEHRVDLRRSVSDRRARPRGKSLSNFSFSSVSRKNRILPEKCGSILLKRESVLAEHRIDAPGTIVVYRTIDRGCFRFAQNVASVVLVDATRITRGSAIKQLPSAQQHRRVVVSHRPSSPRPHPTSLALAVRSPISSLVSSCSFNQIFLLCSLCVSRGESRVLPMCVRGDETSSRGISRGAASVFDRCSSCSPETPVSRSAALFFNSRCRCTVSKLRDTRAFVRACVL